jgi:hypothetical protein
LLERYDRTTGSWGLSELQALFVAKAKEYEEREQEEQLRRLVNDAPKRLGH